MTITQRLLQAAAESNDGRASTKLRGADLAQFKMEIIEWVKANKRVPRHFKGRITNVEQLYARRYVGYVTASSDAYHPEFKEAFYEALGRPPTPMLNRRKGRRNASDVARLKKLILKWVQIHKRRPCYDGAGFVERLLGTTCTWYVSKGMDSFDLMFRLNLLGLLGVEDRYEYKESDYVK